jgi:hypothetical protein
VVKITWLPLVDELRNYSSVVTDVELIYDFRCNNKVTQKLFGTTKHVFLLFVCSRFSSKRIEERGLCIATAY